MKITIITTTLNSANTIRDTLESVLSQTYKDYEHIIIDGGSKDKTIDIIKEYEPKYGGRLRWLTEPDRGLYFAMNKGLSLATGEAIGFLNSDDFFSSDDILQVINEGLHNVQAVYGDVHYVRPKNLKKTVRYYSSAKFHPGKMTYGYMPAHPSFYARREVFDNFGNFDTKFRTAADFELLFRFIYIGKISTRYIPRDFVTMRTGGTTTRGLGSHRRIHHDHVNTYLKHEVKYTPWKEYSRYFFKLFELK